MGALLAAVLLWVPRVDAQAQSSNSGSTVLMRLTGQKSGGIPGEVTQKGREGQHSILAYSHEIVSPRDPQTGLPTGKRQHQPFRVVKLVNRASPVLLSVLAGNELLTSVVIDIWTPTFGSITGAGSESKILSYTLTGAQLVSIRSWMPNQSDAAATNYPPAEELSFVYKKIEVTFHNGGVVGEDDWAYQP